MSWKQFMFAAALILSVGSARAVPVYHLEEGHSLFWRGRYSQAALSYRKAIAESPDLLAAYLNGALAYRNLGDLKNAEELFRGAANLKPDDPDIRSELGWTLCHEQKHVDALKEFSEAVRLQPAHFSALLGSAVSSLQLSDFRQTAEILGSLKKQRPNFAAICFFLGKCFERTGDFSGSLENYVAALQKDWTFAEVRSRLARIYKVQDKMDLAWKQYSRVADLDPMDTDARESAKLLERYLKEPSSASSASSQTKFTAAVQYTGSYTRALNIALWTSPSGKPPRLKKVVFSFNAPFTLAGTRSGKIYAQGQSGELWTAVHARGSMEIESPAGERYGPFKYAVLARPQNAGAAMLVQEARDSKARAVSLSDSREFRGKMRFATDGQRGFYLVNELDLEEYLMGVVPKEMPTHWPMEALKAQAVIARSYAVLRGSSGPHRKQGYDLCDGQHCQVYGGIRAETSNGTQAVTDTRGQLLYSGNSVANTYYHSNCGGHTRTSGEVSGWGKASYLIGRSDLPDPRAEFRAPWEMHLWIKGEPESNCRVPEYVGSTEYRWLRVVPAETLARKLRRKWRMGSIKAVIPLARDSSGHVQELLVRGSRRTVQISSEHEVRHYLGLESLRSTLFIVETVKDSDGNPVEFWFYGGGWGHGIGLCQSGAAGLAERQKFSAEQILQFYYAGTNVR